MEAVKLMDEMLTEEVEEDDQQEGAAEGPDGLTSTQRNKLKKKKLQELERRGAKEDKADDGKNDDTSEPEEVGTEPGPPPIWDEVKKVIESIEMLRAVHEISVSRENPEPELPGGVDPALWYLRSINRLQLCLAPGVLVSLPGQELKRLRHLQTLILNKNSLESLPEEIGRLKELKILEVAENKLKALPQSLGSLKNLELLNVASNEIQSLSMLDGLDALTTLNVSMNQLKKLDLAFENLKRLRSISFSDNQIAIIPGEIAILANLTELIGENNKLEELPVELSSLKKVKTLRLAGNPIQDSKVVKMLQQQGKGLKELWKYLSKQPQKAKREGTSQKGDEDLESADQDEAMDEEVQSLDDFQKKEAGEELETDDSEYDSDDSFDITMDEL